MYELNKIYKTKAMAVNAIRMTATNKGWKVLSTDDAVTHVWPAVGQDGFVVNNTSLNLALEFITDAEASALDALAEASPVAKTDAKLLQKASPLEVQKAEVKAAKKAAKEPKAEGAATRCDVKNGARRPLRGKTLLVWETTEMLAAGPNGTPTLKEVYEELCRLEPGFNKTTAGIQYYACKAYNGWESKK